MSNISKKKPSQTYRRLDVPLRRQLPVENFGRFGFVLTLGRLVPGPGASRCRRHSFRHPLLVGTATNYGCAAAAAAAGWLVLPERGQLSRLWRSPWRTFSRSPDAVDVAFVVRPDDKTHARSHAHFDVSLGGRRPFLGHCTGLGSLCRIAGGHSGPCWVSFCWTHARFPHAIYCTNVVIWFWSPRETLTLQ